MELREVDMQILSLIKSGTAPQSLEEIGNELGKTRASIVNSIKRLEEEGLITQVGNSKTRQYYIPVKALRKIDPKDLDDFDKEIGNISANAKDQFEDIKEKTEHLEKRIKASDEKMNQFYVNIISIMGVFVAIFALISINIKVVADVATTISCAVILTCIVIDVSAVVVIGAMLLLLKWIINNPLKKK